MHCRKNIMLCFQSQLTKFPFSFQQTAAKLDTSGVAFKEALKLPTSSVVTNFSKQYDFYKEQHEGDKKFPVRSITLFNRLALVLDDAQDAAALRMRYSKAPEPSRIVKSFETLGYLETVPVAGPDPAPARAHSPDAVLPRDPCPTPGVLPW